MGSRWSRMTRAIIKSLYGMREASVVLVKLKYPFKKHPFNLLLIATFKKKKPETFFPLLPIYCEFFRLQQRTVFGDKINK